MLLFWLVLSYGCKTAYDTDWQNGIISRFAGTGEPAYSGNGGPAQSAKLNGPAGLAIDKNDNIYVTDLLNCAVRKIDSGTGTIMTVAGTGQKGYEGDGGLASRAKLNKPEGVFVDDQSNIYVADSGNHCIRQIDGKKGIIRTIVGIGRAGFAGDGGKA